MRDGSIEWCCLPRFDSGSAFARILDRERGGHCSISPTAEGGWTFTRAYVDDTLVLQTTMTGPAGEARITDLFVIRDSDERDSGRQILRVIEGLRGAVEFEVRVAARFDYGQVRPWLLRHGHRLRSMIGGNDALVVWCDCGLDEDADHDLTALVTLGVGDRLRLSMTYSPPERVTDGLMEPSARELDDALAHTINWWTTWSQTVTLDSRDEAAARRSAVVLKALTHRPTGAVIAAPTTSLPEAPGGVAELGLSVRLDPRLEFHLARRSGHADDLQVIYGVGGERRIGEQRLDDLAGYDGATPVRIGNGAKGQNSSTPTASSSTLAGAGIAAVIHPPTTSGASSCR